MTRGPYQVMPPLADDEYAALRADIEVNGVLVPVVHDQHGNVLDGHHRAEIADSLGVAYRIDVVQVDDDAHARRLARVYNLTRRHLNRTQRRQLIADEIEADPTRSDREIGRLMGCDHKTVASVRRELGGEIPHPVRIEMTRELAEEFTRAIGEDLARIDVYLYLMLRRGMPKAEVARIVCEAASAAVPPDREEDELSQWWGSLAAGWMLEILKYPAGPYGDEIDARNRPQTTVGPATQPAPPPKR